MSTEMTSIWSPGPVLRGRCFSARTNPGSEEVTVYWARLPSQSSAAARVCWGLSEVVKVARCWRPSRSKTWHPERAIPQAAMAAKARTGRIPIDRNPSSGLPGSRIDLPAVVGILGATMAGAAFKVRLEDGMEVGPLDAEMLRSWYQQGLIKRDSEIRAKGSKRWVRLSDTFDISDWGPSTSAAGGRPRTEDLAGLEGDEEEVFDDAGPQ